MNGSRILSLITTALVCALLGCSGGGPAGTVEDFYRNLEKGELDAAIELLSASTRSTLPAAKLKQGLQQATREIAAKEGIDDIEVLEEDVIGETAEVRVQIVYGNGDEETESSTLIKEDGEWRLQPGQMK